MGQILIRKIDDGALERLQILAKERGMPLEAYARAAIEEVAKRPTPEETRIWLERLDELRKMSPPSDVDSVSILRALRDSDDTDA